MEDADLDEASSLAAAGSYKNSGQRCTEVKRLLVQKSVADRFVDLLMDKTRAWLHGDHAHRRMQMGTVIDDHVVCTFEARVTCAISQGGRWMGRASWREGGWLYGLEVGGDT